MEGFSIALRQTTETERNKGEERRLPPSGNASPHTRGSVPGRTFPFQLRFHRVMAISAICSRLPFQLIPSTSSAAASAARKRRVPGLFHGIAACAVHRDRRPLADESAVCLLPESGRARTVETHRRHCAACQSKLAGWRVRIEDRPDVAPDLVAGTLGAMPGATSFLCPCLP
jgi:hypothetical protein